MSYAIFIWFRGKYDFNTTLTAEKTYMGGFINQFHTSTLPMDQSNVTFLLLTGK